ncbi:hypothetical protein ATANTOWER_016378 [Ataeniobius toweri]|uniref:Uncharacterized protein n=1 Tax=Ataeniobius toweri TaxID=208326 RepID=A0ABU7A299_9TELE|nr:hypothetical protein [Ataeniobius toweri]
MEAQGGAGSPEPNKDIQKLLKPSSSGDLSKELFQHPSGEGEGSLSGHSASLLHISEKRQTATTQFHLKGLFVPHRGWCIRATKPPKRPLKHSN